MDHASDAIFIVDVKTGLFIDANKKAQEITGRSLEEIRARYTYPSTPGNSTTSTRIL